LKVVGRCFGTLYQFHLQRLGVHCTPSFWIWNWYRAPKHRPTTIWRRGNIQKKIYNKYNALLCSKDFNIYYIVVDSDICTSTQGKRIVTFPWQQWLRERTTVLRYSTLLILFDLEALSLFYIMATRTVNEEYSMAVFQCIYSYQRSGFATGRSSGRGNSLTEYMMRMQL